MEPEECRRRFAAADHAYLATAHTGGDHKVAVPHLVPVTFDLTEDEIVVVVDHKPKRTTRLRRLANIESNAAVTFLVDHYETDWSQLWWVRADAHATVVHDGAGHQAAIERLCARYVAYRESVPSGPVIVARVTRWSGWAATKG